MTLIEAFVLVFGCSQPEFLSALLLSIGSPSHLWMRALPTLWSLAIDSNGLFIRALMKHPII